MSGGGGSNWNPGDGLRQLSQNAGQGIGALGNNFTQGAGAVANNWNSGKGNAAQNWNGITAGLGNGDNYNPAKGTLGTLAQGFSNGGDFSAGVNAMKSGWDAQAQPLLNDYQDKLKSMTADTTAGAGISAMLGGDPVAGSIIGNFVGSAANTKQGGDQFNSSQSDQAAQRRQNDVNATNQAQQQKTQAEQQATQDQQTQANQASFNQQNSLEDALRAAALQRQGSRANANLAY